MKDLEEELFNFNP